MKIISTTLTGSNESIIVDALNSVTDHVDHHLIIDTGAKDNTVSLVKGIFGDKCTIINYTWKDDFSDARNFALNSAAELGYDYAITVDTDERIEFRGDSLRQIMDGGYEVASMKSKGGHYGKERVFKLPVTEKYFGPTHECFPGYKFRRIEFPNAVFWETPKSWEGLTHKFNRDIKILEKHTKKNPNDPRWFYYLGESYKNTRQYDKSIQAYKRCYDLNGWDEESAWSCFRMAECFVALNKFREAADVCMDGLKRHSGISELHWMAGWCEYKCGRYQKAVFHAKYAIAGGYVDGFQHEVSRIGFKHPPGLFESPYDLLAWSYKMLGDEVKFEEYKSKHSNALKRREDA